MVIIKIVNTLNHRKQHSMATRNGLIVVFLVAYFLTATATRIKRRSLIGSGDHDNFRFNVLKASQRDLYDGNKNVRRNRESKYDLRNSLENYEDEKNQAENDDELEPEIFNDNDDNDSEFREKNVESEKNVEDEKNADSEKNFENENEFNEPEYNQEDNGDWYNNIDENWLPPENNETENYKDENNGEFDDTLTTVETATPGHPCPEDHSKHEYILFRKLQKLKKQRASKPEKEQIKNSDDLEKRILELLSMADKLDEENSSSQNGTEDPEKEKEEIHELHKWISGIDRDSANIREPERRIIEQIEEIYQRETDNPRDDLLSTNQTGTEESTGGGKSALKLKIDDEERNFSKIIVILIIITLITLLTSFATYFFLLRKKKKPKSELNTTP